MKKKITQGQVIFSYYEKNPNRDIPHKEVVDWAVKEWDRLTGEVFRDPDRAIRKLHGRRLLMKIDTGIYRYDPDMAEEREQIPFTKQQREDIFKRDGYKCVICGRGEKEGQKIQADHIRPRELGGESVIDNGQTLCSQHNYRKKILSQTETGKKMFIGYHRLARKNGDKELADFCRAVLELYDKHDINGHIKWDKKS